MGLASLPGVHAERQTKKNNTQDRNHNTLNNDDLQALKHCKTSLKTSSTVISKVIPYTNESHLGILTSGDIIILCSVVMCENVVKSDSPRLKDTLKPCLATAVARMITSSHDRLHRFHIMTCLT